MVWADVAARRDRVSGENFGQIILYWKGRYQRLTVYVLLSCRYVVISANRMLAKAPKSFSLFPPSLNE